MANIARLKTWNLNETLTSADLNAEFDNILSGTNNGSLDSDNIDQTDTYTWSGNHTFNSLVTHGANLTVGVDDTGHDVQFFGATAGAHLLWDESADTLKMVGGAKINAQGTVTVGVDDTGYDVKFFGATTGKYMLWDESADTLAVVGTAITLNGTAVGDASVGTANTWTADQTFNDNVKLILGTDGDGALYHDGTNMVINPKVVGSGVVSILGKFQTTQTAADVAGLFSLGAATASGPQVIYSAHSPNNTSQFFHYCADATETKAFIYSDGSFQSRPNSYGAISDQRQKQDIMDANSQWDDIKAIPFRKFKWITDVEANGDNARVQLGAIAQELLPICPGLVDHNPEIDEYSVKYSVLYLKGMVALQEALLRIEALEAA